MTVVSVGIGFIKVTAALLDAAESAALTARTVTELELGTLPGAVYMPEELIKPVAELPPVTPFTCQLTVVFDDPVTVALNGCEAPERTLAVLGETETATLEDGDDGEPEEFDGPLVAPVHPARAANRESTKREYRERISPFPKKRRTSGLAPMHWIACLRLCLGVFPGTTVRRDNIGPGTNFENRLRSSVLSRAGRKNRTRQNPSDPYPAYRVNAN